MLWVARFVCVPQLWSLSLYLVIQYLFVVFVQWLKYFFFSLAVICLAQIVFRLCWVCVPLLLFSVDRVLPSFYQSVRSSVPPSPWLTNRGAAFQQCPLSKHLYCGVLLTLLCQTKPRSQWNNPAGWRPSPGSFGAAGPHQNSQPDSRGPAMIAGQETNFMCVSAGSKLDPKFTGHAHLFTRQTDFFIQRVVWASAASLKRQWTHLGNCLKKPKIRFYSDYKLQGNMWLVSIITPSLILLLC